MSSFSVVSDGVVVSVGSFDDVRILASLERAEGHQVCVRRSTPWELAHEAAHLGWAVEVRTRSHRDVLRCLDSADAHDVLQEVHRTGVTAKIVRA